MAKPCKYGCKMLLEWDTEQSMFKEVKTGVYHDKRRCEIMRTKVNVQTPSTSSATIPKEGQQRLIPKGQFEQRGGESEYRRPIDDLLNQHHNAMVQMYNNINSRIDALLNKINEESEKSKEIWKIIDATAAVVGVYKMHSGMDELRQRQQKQKTDQLSDDNTADVDETIEDVDDDADPTDAIAYHEQRDDL